MQGRFIVEFIFNRLINVCRSCHVGKGDSFRLASWLEQLIVRPSHLLNTFISYYYKWNMLLLVTNIEQQTLNVSNKTFEPTEQINAAFDKFDNGKANFIEHDAAKTLMEARKQKIRNQKIRNREKP